MNGRKIFEKYGFVINMICKCAYVLPKSFRIWLYNHSNGRDYLGYFHRYILLYTLLKKCGKNVRIEPNVFINNYEKLSIGDNVSINAFSYIIASGGVEIGNNVSIAHNCSIVSETHNWNDIKTPISYNSITATPIKIEDDVWLGCGVRVIGPCKIQSRVIIAAGAVVKGDLKSHTIYGGIPAKVLKNI